MTAELEVQCETTSANVPGDEKFQLWVDAALEGKPDPFTLTIRVVDEVEARQYNLEYRDKDYATNVLSFPADLPEGIPDDIRDAELGDLLICAPVVAKEALEQKRTENDHWAHLVIHGVLHLQGYDHESANEAVVMESLEIEILAKLGVSDPYQDIA